MDISTEDLNKLVSDAAAGNEAAWWLLWEHLEPKLEGLLRNPRVTGRLANDIDDVRNILVKVIEKLRAEDNRRLREYCKGKDPTRSFEAWVVVVTKRVAIDYQRSHPDYIDKRRSKDSGDAGEWVFPNELPSDSQMGGDRPPLTNRGTALTLLRFAYESLPPEQMGALELWILNKSYQDISEELSLGGADHAQKRVRSALEKIRRRFRDG